MPIIYVRDKSTYEIVWIEESYNSLVWTERYQEAGEFILELPLRDVNYQYYQRGNYIQLDTRPETMIIESRNYNENGDKVFEVTGRNLSSLLERRVNASKLTKLYTSSSDPVIHYSGDYGSVIQSIVNDDLINPTVPTFTWRHTDTDGNVVDGYDPDRPTSNFKVEGNVSAPYRAISNFSVRNTVTGVTIDKEFSEVKTLYDIIVSISKKYVTGFRVVLENGTFVLETYKGTDRSTKQQALNPLIFAHAMDNLEYINKFDDATSYKNVCLVYSDDSWAPSEYNVSMSSSIYPGFSWVADLDETANESLTGLDRIELPKKSSTSVSSYDPSSYYYPEMGEEPDPNDWIITKLTNEGKEEFDSDDYKLIDTSEGAIANNVGYEYGVDYFLGDSIEIITPEGVAEKCLVDEVVISYDSNGHTITPNFKNLEDYDYGEDEEEGEEEK